MKSASISASHCYCGTLRYPASNSAMAVDSGFSEIRSYCVIAFCFGNQSDLSDLADLSESFDCSGGIGRYDILFLPGTFALLCRRSPETAAVAVQAGAAA